MYKIYFITLLAFPIIFSACQTTVDIPLPPHEKRIVVNGLLEADKEIEVYISQSYGPTEDLNSEEVMLPDAVVELSQNGELISTFVYRDTTVDDWRTGGTVTIGKFVAEGMIAKAGETYQLNVSHPNFPPVSATATTPPKVRVITGEFELEAARKVYQDGYTEIQSIFRLTVKDTAAFDNFYKLESLFVTTTDIFGGGQDTIQLQVWNLDGEAMLAGDGSLETTSKFVSDETFNGQEKTIDFLVSMPHIYVNNTPVIDYEIFGFEGVISTSFKPYKNYIEKLELQRSSQDGIGFLPSEPVVVDSNIENGYGMWGGATRTSFKVVF